MCTPVRLSVGSDRNRATCEKDIGDSSSGAGEMVPCVKGLQWKHGDASAIPSNHRRKLDMLVHALTLVLEESSLLVTG